jgi:hypothetical protein
MTSLALPPPTVTRGCPDHRLTRIWVTQPITTLAGRVVARIATMQTHHDQTRPAKELANRAFALVECGKSTSIPVSTASDGPADRAQDQQDDTNQQQDPADGDDEGRYRE